MSSSPLADIDRQPALAEVVTKLYTKSIGSDVTFELDDAKQFKAHRNILAAQSPVFASMLLDHSFKESKEEIVKLPGKRSDSLEIFLKFLYTYRLEASKLGLDTMIDILNIAHEYQVTILFDAICQTLQCAINSETIFKIFEAAILLESEKLLEECRDYFSLNNSEILKSPQFVNLSKSALTDLISQDDFFAKEIDILVAICRWHGENKEIHVGDVLAKIRFDCIDSLDGLSLAQGSALFKFLHTHGFEFSDRIGTVQAGTLLPRHFRFQITTNNIATFENGAIIEGPDEANVGRVLENTSAEVGYAVVGTPITIKFCRTYQVSSMSFNIYAGPTGRHTCGYKVETSLNGKAWDLLAKCGHTKCIGRQLVMFQPKCVRYVRIIGCRDDKIYCYGVGCFQCPSSNVTKTDKARYAEKFPNGGVLRLQNDNDPRLDSHDWHSWD